MKRSTFYGTLLWVVAAAFHASAQTPATATPRPTPPSGPLLEKAPDPGAWTIVSHTIPGLGSQSADAVARAAAERFQPEEVISVTKAGFARHETVKSKNGPTNEIWSEYGLQIMLQTGWQIPAFLEGGYAGTNAPPADFPELSWVSTGTFVGTTVYQGAAYLVFETQRTSGNAATAKIYGFGLQPVFNRVYVNADTRLPWLAQLGDVLKQYTFQPSAEALAVPPAYQAMFDNYTKVKAEGRKTPAPP